MLRVVQVRRDVLFLSGMLVGFVLAATAGGPLVDALALLVEAKNTPPESSMDPLPEYVNSQVVYANFTSMIGRGRILWTELWYERDGSGWVMYAPWWNPSGHWLGDSRTGAAYVAPADHDDDDDDDDCDDDDDDCGDDDDDDEGDRAEGTIPFDTYLTGGEGPYDFYTIAVGKKDNREAPPVEPDASTFVDGTPPDIAVHRPASNAWTTTADVVWTANDASSGAEAVSIRLDGSSVGTPQPPVGHILLADLETGPHRLRFEAMDRAGNMRAVEVPFSFDPNAPAVQFTAPAANAFVSDPHVDVSWSAAETVSDIDHFDFLLDSGSPLVLDGSARSIALPDVAEGLHILVLSATDLAGNTAFATLSFSVDVTPPELGIVMPSEGAYIAGTALLVLWTADDEISGIDRYEVALDRDPPVVLARAGAYTFPDVGEGPHAVSVTAVDRAGNVREATVGATLDATAPELVVTSPVHGTTFIASVPVEWSAADSGSGLARVELSLDGGPPVDVTGRTRYTITAPKLGPHALTMRAVDLTGNEAEVTLAFAVVPTPPVSPTGPVPMEFWAIIAIMAIAGFTFWAVRRRIRGPGGER